VRVALETSVLSLWHLRKKCSAESAQTDLVMNLMHWTSLEAAPIITLRKESGSLNYGRSQE
jgi:hypothetical protein